VIDRGNGDPLNAKRFILELNSDLLRRLEAPSPDVFGGILIFWHFEKMGRSWHPVGFIDAVAVSKPRFLNTYPHRESV